MSPLRSDRWSSPCPPGHIRPNRPGSRKPGRGSRGPFASGDLTARELSCAHPKGARSVPTHVATMGELPERSVGEIWEPAESFGAQPFVTFWGSRRLYSYTTRLPASTRAPERRRVHAFAERNCRGA